MTLWETGAERGINMKCYAQADVFVTLGPEPGVGLEMGPGWRKWVTVGDLGMS